MNNHSFRLTGLHHVSSVSAHIGQSRDFFTRVLGMRPVITTVNQDDTSMYHLFFGDGAGSPGSDMTVFDIPHAERERRGNNSISRTTFRVNGKAALDYWAARFDELEITHGGVSSRDDRLVLDFDDFVGTELSLVDDGGAGEAFPWDGSPVPAAFQVRGLGYVMMTVPELLATNRFLVQALGLRLDHSYVDAARPDLTTHVFVMGEGGVHAQVHVSVQPDLPRAAYGSGGVHHLALRLTVGDSQQAWVDRLNSLGYHNSGIVDRHYFHSVYVREPNHILFELATDGPGFEVDGPMDADRLSLPPFLEPKRQEIEQKLRPIS